MGKPPAFQLYAADFYVDTSGWTTSEVGTYFRLLLTEWVNGPLPNNMSELARIAGISDTRTMVKIWNRNVGKKFILNGGNLLYNKRLEEERENQAKRRELQAEKGLSGAKKRWKDHIAPAITQAQPKDSSSSSSSSSIQKKIYKRKVLLPDEEWIKELQKKECYSHLKVGDQFQRCTTYFETIQKAVSRRRFLVWLNDPRNAKPMQVKPNKEFKPEPNIKPGLDRMFQDAIREGWK